MPGRERERVPERQTEIQTEIETEIEREIERETERGERMQREGRGTRFTDWIKESTIISW